MKKLLLLLASVAAIFTACEGGLDNDENGVPAESNKILYTSSDGSMIIPNKSDVFGANIISNDYDAEKECWVINFDAPVTSIGERAFAWCESLISVYCKATTPPTGGSNMFYSNASGRKIYVPRNSVEAYKSAEYWSDYASDIEGYDF